MSKGEKFYLKELIIELSEILETSGYTKDFLKLLRQSIKKKNLIIKKRRDGNSNHTNNS